MNHDPRAQFDAGAEAWASYNQEPLGRIRRLVTWHNLMPYLPEVVDAEHPPRVLDAGGGSGELALELAQCGYRVWLLDYAPAMLEQARHAIQALPNHVQARLTLCQTSAEEAGDVFAPGFFDVVACHTMVEYLPDPQSTLRALVGTLDKGGLLSLSFVNHHAEVLRQVWARSDPAGALASLEDGTFCAKLFDLKGRAFRVEQVVLWLKELNLQITARCGVRAFADYVPRHRLVDPAFFDELVQLEKAAAHRPPYLLLARYIHLLAHKEMETL